MALEIPIDSRFPYFVQTSQIENVAFQFEFVWNERDERWRISILDMQDNYILQNLKIVHLVPMTRRYRIKNLFKGDLIGIDTNKNTYLPTRKSLGNEFRIYYLNEDELKIYNLDKIL